MPLITNTCTCCFTSLYRKSSNNCTASADGMDTSAVYDLQGRRVNNPQHGLYIVNGKQVVMK